MKTIEEKNRLIAEFIGFKVMKEDDFLSNPRAEHLKNVMVDVAMKYHTSWDWLMPVVEKIERLGFTIEKNFQPIDNDWQCLVVKGNDILFQEFNEESIQAMHCVVSEFIQMYNKQK